MQATEEDLDPTKVLMPHLSGSHIGLSGAEKEVPKLKGHGKERTDIDVEHLLLHKLSQFCIEVTSHVLAATRPQVRTVRTSSHAFA